MQLLGKGLKTISIVVALLGMRVALGSYKTWKEMMDKLGTIQETLAEKCCMDNLQKEIDATKERGNIDMRDGRIGIIASGDAGWQGGGSHMTYNSISGHTLLIGGYTKLILAFQFFSKMCATCDNFYKKKKKNPDANLEELPPDHCCAKNWSESSKAMEPMRIVECAIKIWNYGKAWLCVFVSDDDSSSCAALKHSYEDKI